MVRSCHQSSLPLQSDYSTSRYLHGYACPNIPADLGLHSLSTSMGQRTKCCNGVPLSFPATTAIQWLSASVCTTSSMCASSVNAASSTGRRSTLPHAILQSCNSPGHATPCYDNEVCTTPSTSNVHLQPLNCVVDGAAEEMQSSLGASLWAQQRQRTDYVCLNLI
jgi:hypothetical protein